MCLVNCLSVGIVLISKTTRRLSLIQESLDTALTSPLAQKLLSLDKRTCDRIILGVDENLNTIRIHAPDFFASPLWETLLGITSEDLDLIRGKSSNIFSMMLGF